MTEERRQAPREVSFEIVSVIRKGSEGDQGSFTIMLRDKSDTGLGAVYVGPSPPEPGDEYFLEEREGCQIRIEVAWVARLANHVYNLGLRFREA